MNRGKKTIVIALCVLFLAIGWVAAIFSKTDADRQKELLESAQVYLDDEIYIKAVPLLEEAAGYDAKYTLQAEEKLKEAYIPLLSQSGYTRKYTNLLTKQMARADAQPAVYLEAAEYYLGRSKETEAFDALKLGIEKTGDQELIDYYEDNRYIYDISHSAYQEVTDFLNGMIQVRQDGYWGLAMPNGNLTLPCEYDHLSTYYEGVVIAERDGLLEGLDTNGNRLALYKGETVSEITNYNEKRLAVHQSDGWVLATDELNTGSVVFEEVGMFSDGGAAAKIDGKWGVVGRNGQDWLVEPIYDGIVCDDLGRCWYEDTVFVRQGDQVLLLVDGQQVGETYEDARPFAGGWAAVQKDGLWGYIDQTGTVQIEFQFDEARSFTMHLAAVKMGRNWGYVGLDGSMVIEPIFLNAKAFSEGTAPVKTRDGWQFITLLEYDTGSFGL